MEESKKKAIMIVVIVACLVLAGTITYRRTVGASEDLSAFAGQTIWVVCTNEDCEAQYMMDKKDYYEDVTKKGKGFSIPALVCKDCGEESIYITEKCEKCGTVFFKGSVQEAGSFSDTCPECGHSAFETKRRNLGKQKQ